MKRIALKDHPRYRMYRALRKAVQREIEPVIFDLYCGSCRSPEEALDDYLRVHFQRIALDLKHILRADLEEKEARYREQLSRCLAQPVQAPVQTSGRTAPSSSNLVRA